MSQAAYTLAPAHVWFLVELVSMYQLLVSGYIGLEKSSFCRLTIEPFFGTEVTEFDLAALNFWGIYMLVY